MSVEPSIHRQSSTFAQTSTLGVPTSSNLHPLGIPTKPIVRIRSRTRTLLNSGLCDPPRAPLRLPVCSNIIHIPTCTSPSPMDRSPSPSPLQLHHFHPLGVSTAESACAIGNRVTPPTNDAIQELSPGCHHSNIIRTLILIFTGFYLDLIVTSTKPVPTLHANILIGFQGVLRFFIGCHTQSELGLCVIMFKRPSLSLYIRLPFDS